MLTDFQAGAVGTQACMDAVKTISGLMGDLETTAMFCTAGALPPSNGKYVPTNLFVGRSREFMRYTQRVVFSVLFSFLNCYYFCAALRSTE